MREKKPGGRLVCVKQIHNFHSPTMAPSSSSSVMEVRLMKKLSHPNLIRFLDSFPGHSSSNPGNGGGKHKQSHCIVMEFCSGGDLRAYLQQCRGSSKKQPLTEDMIWFWFLQLCLGLHHMHQLHILHRDIKTSNIFLSNAGFLVLGDFGIARELGSSNEMASTVIGTPLYMAPETLEGKPYGFASDIWALGCVLYEICTGNPPFIAKSTPALMNKICESKFTPLSKTKFSSRLQDLVSAMLKVDATARPTTTSILMDPSIHAHLKRYFQDRCSRVSSDPIAGKLTHKAEEQFTLTKQLHSLGVSISSGSETATDEKREQEGGKRGSASSGATKESETKLMVQRAQERREQLLLGLDKLQRLRLQEGLAAQNDVQKAGDLAAVGGGSGRESTSKPTAQSVFPAFPRFRRVPGDEQNDEGIRWKDPVQHRPKSPDRNQQTSYERPQRNSVAFLGVPRTGVPLTSHAKEFASLSPVCKDVRVLRKRERAIAAEKYKQKLESLHPVKPSSDSKVAAVAPPKFSSGGMVETQTDKAILHSIADLQDALDALKY